MSFTKRKSVILNKRKGGDYFLNKKYKKLLSGSIVNLNDDDMDVNYDDSDCVAY